MWILSVCNKKYISWHGIKDVKTVDMLLISEKLKHRKTCNDLNL